MREGEGGLVWTETTVRKQGGWQRGKSRGPKFDFLLSLH